MEQSAGVKVTDCRYCGADCKMVLTEGHEYTTMCCPSGTTRMHYKAFFNKKLELDRDYFYNGLTVVSRYHRHNKTWVALSYKGIAIERVLSDDEVVSKINSLKPWNLFI